MSIKYTYYHCVGGCKHRTNSDIINEAVEKDLLRFIPKVENKDLYGEVISHAYAEWTNEDRLENKEALIQIKEYEERLSYARELLVTKEIDASDYREMKTDYGKKISELELKLTSAKSERENVEDWIDKGLAKLSEIESSLKDKGIMEIREDIGSIYPEKVVFKENKVRTARRNEFIECINLINKGLRQNKNGTKLDISTLSRQVGVAGFEPLSYLTFTFLILL